MSDEILVRMHKARLAFGKLRQQQHSRDLPLIIKEYTAHQFTLFYFMKTKRGFFKISSCKLLVIRCIRNTAYVCSDYRVGNSEFRPKEPKKMVNQPMKLWIVVD